MRILILALAVPALFILAATQPAAAAVVPHGSYSSETDFCLSCHDVHGAAGDYVLMREASVTETCATCHGLFGQAAPGPIEAYTEFDWVDGTNATASQYTAYETLGIDRVSGHRLGVELNGEPGRQSDNIPVESANGIWEPVGLRVMRSQDYDVDYYLYNNEPPTAFSATAGLYCASCHTPHGSLTGVDTDGNGFENIPDPDANWGQQLVADEAIKVRARMLLSSKPNHATTAVEYQYGTYNGFCVACHDSKDDQTPEVHNHPPLCMGCHGFPANDPDSKDFPHTSVNQKLLADTNDALCTNCHAQAQGLP